MSDLGGAIDLVVQRISKHGAASFNEENTAVVLIEPVLAALGWDLSDLGRWALNDRVLGSPVAP